MDPRPAAGDLRSGRGRRGRDARFEVEIDDDDASGAGVPYDVTLRTDPRMSRVEVTL